MSTYKVLTTEQLNTYHIALDKYSGGDDFVTKTNLENTLIKQYGFDGVKLIFEYRGNSNNYYLLGCFPENSPWFYLNEGDICSVIDEIFYSVRNKIPKIISSLKERCKFIYVEEQKGNWSLHYLMEMKLYDDRDYFLVYVGGSPNPNPTENKNLKKFNWKIPKDLKEFYAIHNGFGLLPYDGDVHSILSNEELKVMGSMMNTICKEQNTYPINYTFNDLLEFFPDGTGNAQCFIRTSNSNNLTVDWDHELWEISEKENFFEFIDERMSQIDEE